MFVHVQNTGAAFGIFSNKQLFLVGVGLLVFAIITLYRIKRPELPRYLDVGLGFLMGGLLGNLSDRIFHGFVVDFIKLPYWPTFNMADIAINVGVVFITYYLIFTPDDEKEKSHPAPPC